MAKLLRNNAGNITEVNTVQASAGAADADKVPSLDANGRLAASLVNSVQSSAGAGDAAKVVALDSSGKLSSTMMPAGMGADSLDIVTTEVIAAGAFCNIWNSTGTKVRNADASNGREAHCFTITGGGSGATITCYFETTNTAVTSKTPGATQFLAATPGAATETAPSTAGQIVQRLGVATSATTINFEPQPPITLA